MRKYSKYFVTTKKKTILKFFIESKICSNLGIISKFYIKF